MNNKLPGEQRRMNSIGPVLALMRRRHFCESGCGDAVLRLAISEERANVHESERWCGAANLVLATREAICDFLFQICTTPRRKVSAPQARFNWPKSVMVLALRRLAGVSRRTFQHRISPAMRVLMRCPGCAGIDSDVFNALRMLAYGVPS
ncbi:MAG TPA: hypothetical protein VGM85_18620 [Paraburkholderia sp.]|jgi:hypothetical protein